MVTWPPVVRATRGPLRLSNLLYGPRPINLIPKVTIVTAPRPTAYDRAMVRTGRPRKGDVQIPVRVTRVMLAKLEAIRVRLERETGLPLSRADVVRLVLAKGLEAMGK